MTLFSFMNKKRISEDTISQKDIDALSGLNELRDAMIEQGVRAYYVTFINRDGNTGFIWRNADEDKLRIMADAMIARGLEIDEYLKGDPSASSAADN